MAPRSKMFRALPRPACECDLGKGRMEVVADARVVVTAHDVAYLGHKSLASRYMRLPLKLKSPLLDLIWTLRSLPETSPRSA